MVIGIGRFNICSHAVLMFGIGTKYWYSLTKVW